ncbi:MAG TPA: DUF1152 domain-containing protein [Actinomycetota bacterium]|nr:DUF1152 domain-containing protein [Actinomycetota bacterium]
MVFVAAGGGGDALATAMLHRAMSGGSDEAVIATYAWDRLLIDPLPGPRSPSSFTGLEPIGHHNFAVSGTTSAIPPAGSTLPRLAGELSGIRLVVLDPEGGAVGMREQLRELVEIYRPEALQVVDVGGDVLAEGNEAELRSPLADGLVAAAATNLPVDVDVLVAGPGLDGELPEAYVRERVRQLGGELMAHLQGEAIERFLPILEWHPSEATALLVAAAGGLRGTVEIRGAGLPVRLTEHSADVYRAPQQAVQAASPIVRALVGTHSLGEAECRVREACGFSELDYERAKAGKADPSRECGGLDERALRFEREAQERGVDFVTFRRLAEALGVRGADWGRLRAELVRRRPAHYAPPLWAVSAGPVG